MNRLLDWLCTHLGLCIRFDGDLMTPDCPDDAPDPHYRKPTYIYTPQQHAARLKERRR